ncbi:MAG: D-alanyl-D-alanine carboxypeptidase [Ruminococcaceae bacterium]|nr:D-alanyl-D-alanine carboxypeptidase [Oscillospiraceae bacterium]
MSNLQKNIILSFLLSALLCSAVSISAKGNESNLGLSAQHACLYVPEANITAYNKAANERHSMASTTKIMTALIALENSTLDRIVTVSEKAVGIEGSSVYLKGGDKYTMNDLLYALLLQSANDAACAIAIELGGSIEGFADMMNEKAASMGLSDTHFENPHGLDSENHYTTAKELALITAEALKNPDFKTIVSTYRKTISTVDGECVRTVVNHNKMLLLYEDAIGVKTGFTKKTGRCLVSAAERDGLTLISVTLNASNDWSDHKKLLDFGFEKYEKKVLAEAGELLFDTYVLNGEKQTVRCSNPYEVSLITERLQGDITQETELNRMISAPVKKGDILGYVFFKSGDTVLATSPLLAEEDIEEIKIKKGPFGFFE